MAKRWSFVDGTGSVLLGPAVQTSYFNERSREEGTAPNLLLCEYDVYVVSTQNR